MISFQRVVLQAVISLSFFQNNHHYTVPDTPFCAYIFIYMFFNPGPVRWRICRAYTTGNKYMCAGVWSGLIWPSS